MKIVIGTRGSKLAIAQTEWAAERLRELGAAVTVQVVRTSGDRRVVPVPEIGIGVFVKEIEEALRRGERCLCRRERRTQDRAIPLRHASPAHRWDPPAPAPLLARALPAVPSEDP